MFISVQADQYPHFPGILDQMFRLRKTTFHDELGWEVQIDRGYERDRYDDLGPVYLVWCDETHTRLYASIRLMPTTGPTLLYDVFRDTFPEAVDLTAPGIWEATRACIHRENLKRDCPGVSPLHAFGLMCLAAAECAYENAIDIIVVTYEPHFGRAYQSAGASVVEIGRSDGFGRHPVCCGLFEISERVISRMRSRLGLSGPVYAGAGRVQLRLSA